MALPGVFAFSSRLICATATVLALLALPSQQLVAQTMVQNVDEPGRNPYQEATFGLTTQPGPGLFSTSATFSKVPAGTRRVILHANCRVTAPSGSNVYTVSLSDAADFGFFNAEALPTSSSGSDAFTQFNGYSENPLYYFEAGKTPQITVTSSTAPNFVSCRLSGYNIKLKLTKIPPGSPGL